MLQERISTQASPAQSTGLNGPATLPDVIQATRRIAPYVFTTPIVRSSLLNRWLGHDILFKAECLQRTGSFKARGACNFVRAAMERDETPMELVCSSSGNHAQAIAWAAALFGIASRVFMAKTASSVKVKATQSYGAKVELCDTRLEADERVRDAANVPGTMWAPPFNHELIIAGQGTAAFEALSETGEVDAVFAPCGGGGLLSGTLIAARALTPKAMVAGVEPQVANDAAESRKAGEIRGLAGPPDTLADGAMTPRVGDKTFPYLRALDDFFTVKEDTIQYWTQWLNHLLKHSVEPTSALVMGGVVQWLAHQEGRKRVLVILSGGNVDQAKMLKVWSQDCLTKTPSLD